MFDNLRNVLQSLVWLAIVLAASMFFFGGGSLTSLQVIVTYVAITLILMTTSYLQKPRPRVHEGWHYLTPSAMEWLGLLSAVVMTLVCLLVYHFVGSARADADSQMFILKILTIVFAAGTGIIFYSSFASELRWNDHVIEQHRPFLARKTIRLADIVDGGMIRWAECLWVAGSDGTVIYFSSYANGVETLARTIFPPEHDATAP
jgi:hypothetical protein